MGGVGKNGDGLTCPILGLAQRKNRADQAVPLFPRIHHGRPPWPERARRKRLFFAAGGGLARLQCDRSQCRSRASILPRNPGRLRIHPAAQPRRQRPELATHLFRYHDPSQIMRRKIVDRAEVQVSRGSWGEPDLRNFLGLAQRKNRAEPGYPSFRRSVRYGVCVRTSPTSSAPKGRLFRFPPGQSRLLSTRGCGIILS
jgi:hypothetical protein